MNIFITKERIITGTSYSEVYPKALAVYKIISKKTKRRPYVRSLHFKNQKIFLDYFWAHIRSKTFNDRVRRLKYYICALDLIKNSNNEPLIQQNPMKNSETLFRFKGQTREGLQFFVQIKKGKNNQKHFLSVFPL